MGLLVDGKWQDKWYDTESTGGRFKRQVSSFRKQVTADGSGDGFKAESGRYHLYVSYACPWAHRALIFRKLKKLEEHISLSVVHWYMGEHGWTFDDGEGVIPDPVHGADYLYQVYQAADPEYTGRVTVPVLWDLERNTIVNNESAEIIRMLNSAFDAIAAPGDFYPEAHRAAIDEINDRVYTTVNNGVTNRDSQRRSRPMKKPLSRCSTRSNGWTAYSRTVATWSATRSPRLTGACSRRCCASIPFTMGTSSAIGAV